VLEAGYRPERECRMARLAAFRAEDMRGRLCGGTDARARGVASRAQTWRCLEHAIDVAALAAHVAMCAGQFEARRQMIEGRRWLWLGSICAGGQRGAKGQQQGGDGLHGHCVIAAWRDGMKSWNGRFRSACRTDPGAHHRSSGMTCNRVPVWPHRPGACGRCCIAGARGRR
jgi:hypothetical protein